MCPPPQAGGFHQVGIPPGCSLGFLLPVSTPIPALRDQRLCRGQAADGLSEWPPVWPKAWGADYWASLLPPPPATWCIRPPAPPPPASTLTPAEIKGWPRWGEWPLPTYILSLAWHSACWRGAAGSQPLGNLIPISPFSGSHYRSPGGFGNM